ncbi:MAG: DUF2975 domain-containing protein [Lachnospiraceae bacterium]|nr:DUF2975 domain-containing protein [Lachnospiraceae bacterium]MBR1852947.1 DUF2975 domain-containing protein [Lachnospiraceae bacterium]
MNQELNQNMNQELNQEMNKETAIKKINRIGKAGYIISVIAQIFVIIAIVGTIVAGTVLLLLPQDAVVLTAKGSLGIAYRPDKMGGIQIAEQQMEEFGNLEANISVDGRKYVIKDIEVTGIEAGEGTVRLAAETPEVTMDLKTFRWPLVSALIYMVMTMVTLLFIKGLCKEIKVCESPFCQEVITKLKRLAYALIPWVFLSGITDSIINSAFTGRANVDLNVDLGMVMIVLIVLALAYIFQYGAVLQQESDETL